MRAEYAGASDVGLVRTNNEDSWVGASNNTAVLAAVADGLGGHESGEIASQMATKALSNWFERHDGSSVISGIVRAHEDVLHLAQQQSSNMGTTLSAVLIDLDSGQMDIGHVGDSRIYLWRSGQLRQLSEDDTVAQAKYADGLISADEMRTSADRHRLTQAVGISQSLNPHAANIMLRPGDRVLLCSDGLSGELTDEAIATELAGPNSAEQATHSLLKAALATEARDNVTALVVFIM